MMRRLNSFSIIFTFFLLILTSSLAAAMMTSEVLDITYQLNNTDHVVIGNVSKVEVYDTHTIYTITVSEWLYNPLPPEENVKVISNIGSRVWVEDEVELTINEPVLLMLQDGDPRTQLYRVTFGFPGKHPVSDRDAIIEALKAQGKIKTETQPANKTIVGYPAIMTETQKPEKENTTVYIDKAPFVSPVWAVAIMLIAIIYSRRQK